MLTGSPLAPLAVLIMLAMVPVASGITPHEDYDSAELDLTMLRYYTEKALDHLESSLKKGAEGDYGGSLNESRSFSNQVRRAETTLRLIPHNLESEEYSYDYLNEYIWSLGSAERNLSVMTFSLSEHMSHIADLRMFRASEWTRISLSENLSMMDSAISGLRATKGKVIPACHDLDANIRTLLLMNLSLPEALTNLEKITTDAESLQTDLTFDQYVSILFRPLLAEWRADLDSIVREVDPPGRILSMLEVLDPIVPDLSSELRVTILSGSDTLRIASVIDLEMRDDQMDFLKRFDDLNTSIGGKDGITTQLALLQIVTEKLADLDSGVERMTSAYIPVTSYDDGSVRNSINDVSDLIESYHERIDGLELVFNELNEISDRLSSILVSNLLSVDPDMSMSISDDEARMLSIPDLDDALIETGSLLDYINEIILDMDQKTAEHYIPPIEGLRSLYMEVGRFYSSHAVFLSGIEAYLERSRSGEEHLLRSIEALSMMKWSLDSIGGSITEIDESGLVPDTEVHPKLVAQHELYEDLLFRLLEGSDTRSRLTLTLGEDTAPYDDELHYRLIAIERRMDGKLRFIEDGIVTVYLDGKIISTLRTVSGISSSELTISRDYPLGEHVISADMTLSNGTVISDSKNFTLRKIRTFIGCEPEDLILEPSETGTVKIWIRDEMDRPVTGRIERGSETVGEENTGVVKLAYQTTGIFTEALSFPGDLWYEGAIRTVNVTVSYRPVLSLLPEHSVIMIGGSFNLTWSMDVGSGSLSIRSGEHSIGLGEHMNGSLYEVMINSTILGMGNHTAILRLESAVPWCRHGESAPVTISVLSIEQYSDWINRTKPKPDEPEPEKPDVDDPPVQRPDDPMGPPQKVRGPWDFLPGGWFSDLIREYALFLVLGIGIVSFSVTGVIYLRRDPLRRQRIGSSKPESVEVMPLPNRPDLRRTEKKGPRERMINAYCDVLDAAPGAGYHMTPREVSSHLRNGCAYPVDDPIPVFERVIYSVEGVPDPNPIVAGFKTIKEWLSGRFGGGAA